jgi:hypothetical protein
MSRFFWPNAPYVIHKRGEDPLGHPPDHTSPEYIGPDFPALALNVHGYLPVNPRPKKLVHINPSRGCNFWIKNQGRAARDGEQKRAHRNGRQCGRPRHDIGQGPEQSLTGEGNTDFLRGLSEGRSQQIIILGIPASTWQRHVPGPGIARTFSSLDQENGVWRGGDDQGYGCPDQGRIVVSSKGGGSEMLPETK